MYMAHLLENKYLIGKGADLIKFSLTLGALCFLMVQAPDQAGQIIGTAGAFILGGSKLREKLGL